MLGPPLKRGALRGCLSILNKRFIIATRYAASPVAAIVITTPYFIISVLLRLSRNWRKLGPKVISDLVAFVNSKERAIF